MHLSTSYIEVLIVPLTLNPISLIFNVNGNYTITHIVGEKPKIITIKVDLKHERIRELNKKIGELK